MRENMKTEQEQIAALAFEAWQRDGSPQGRDLEYWLQAERQFHAGLMLVEPKLPAPEAPAKPRSKGTSRVASSAALKAARALAPR
jgi:Protein of unknown function (DUF2934)